MMDLLLVFPSDDGGGSRAALEAEVRPCAHLPASQSAYPASLTPFLLECSDSSPTHQKHLNSNKHARCHRQTASSKDTTSEIQ